ncbi:MAG: thiamine pyrophosphate-dependent enzyme, partial [Acidimicrobiales bacterium]
VVELLAGAERPLIVTTRLGRTPGASEALARLAELAAIPVVGRPDAVNLPSGHPMACRDPGQAAELLSSADVVLVVEADVPWLPSGARPPDSATVVVIDPDPLRANMPLWTFASDIAVTADGGTALRQLADALEAGGPGPDRGPAPVLRPPRAGGQVDEVLLALNDVLSPDDLVLDETVTNMDAVARLLDRRQPGTLLSSGAPGLGWSLGASVGVKLAAPQRRVVTVVGDGSFMFGVPTSAFCLAAEAEAPFMAVVLNNNGYRASRMPVLELFPGGVSDRAGQVVGTRFRRPPSPADVARACGGWGEAVDDLAGLRDVLAAGLKAVDAGSVAVVDVKIDQD